MMKKENTDIVVNVQSVVQFQPREFSAATGAEMLAVRAELLPPLLPLP